MPIYEFSCIECGGRFEELLKASDGPPACPSCAGRRVRRQLSVFAAGRSAEGLRGAAGGCACGGSCACGA